MEKPAVRFLRILRFLEKIIGTQNCYKSTLNGGCLCVVKYKDTIPLRDGLLKGIWKEVYELLQREGLDGKAFLGEILRRNPKTDDAHRIDWMLDWIAEHIQ